MKEYPVLAAKTHRKMIASGFMSAVMVAGFGLTACASVIDDLPSFSITREMYKIPLQGLRENVVAVLIPGFGILALFIGFRAVIALLNHLSNH